MNKRQATDEEVDQFLNDTEMVANVRRRMSELDALNWSSSPVWHPTHGKAVIRDVASDFEGVWLRLESGDDWWITMTDILNIKTTEPESPCELYRWYNAGGELLYVGISMNAAKRAAEHRKDKSWWDEAKRMDKQKFASRREAADAERLAIRTEYPKYNVVHAVKPGTNHPATTKQVWVCRHCNEPIKDGDGYLQVDVNRAVSLMRREHELRIEAAQTNRLITFGGDRPWPSLEEIRSAGWEALHRKCDPDVGGSQYWIGVERIRTMAQMLDWNAHLCEKEWVHHTTWTRFIQHKWQSQ